VGEGAKGGGGGRIERRCCLRNKVKLECLSEFLNDV